MLVVVGYERVDKYNQVVDMVVKKENGKFKVVLPQKPKQNVNIADASFIAFDHYREKNLTEGVQLSPAFINSDGREYVAMKTSNTRPQTVFRLIDLDTEEEYYLIRVRVEEKVGSVEQSNEVPQVYRNEAGNLEVEKPREIEHIQKEVTILTLTTIEGDWKPKLWEKAKQQLRSGFVNEIIKETGDSEIALAVLNNKVKKYRNR